MTPERGGWTPQIPGTSTVLPPLWSCRKTPEISADHQSDNLLSLIYRNNLLTDTKTLDNYGSYFSYTIKFCPFQAGMETVYTTL